MHHNSSTVTTSIFSARGIAMIGMTAALMAVISQISIPMPGGVPVTLQIFGIAFIGMLLGWKKGLAAIIVYILIGAVGAPVFANFGAGIGILAGPSGGYIIAWPVMTALCGLHLEKGGKVRRMLLLLIPALIGLAAVELFGAFWWSWTAKSDLGAILIYAAAAFIPKDCILTVIGIVLGDRVRRLIRAGGIMI